MFLVDKTRVTVLDEATYSYTIRGAPQSTHWLIKDDNLSNPTQSRCRLRRRSLERRGPPWTLGKETPKSLGKGIARGNWLLLKLWDNNQESATGWWLLSSFPVVFPVHKLTPATTKIGRQPAQRTRFWLDNAKMSQFSLWRVLATYSTQVMKECRLCGPEEPWVWQFCQWISLLIVDVWGALCEPQAFNSHSSHWTLAPFWLRWVLISNTPGFDTYNLRRGCTPCRGAKWSCQQTRSRMNRTPTQADLAEVSWSNVFEFRISSTTHGLVANHFWKIALTYFDEAF